MAQRNPSGVSELSEVQRPPLNPALTQLPHCLKDPLKQNLPDRPTTAMKAVIPISNISGGTNTPSQPLVRRSPRKRTSTQRRSQPLHIAARTGPSNESVAKFLDFDSQKFTSQLDQFQGLEFEDRDPVARLYSYLSLKTVKEIHHINRPWKLKVRNRTKEQLVARILIDVYISNRKGTSLSNLISMNSGLADFGDWEEKSMKNLFT
ncbi:hypothetical protein BWQ96_05147 [Gracilariopsis chorda]|uniref:Uncharacterized protein n=1 Tax=Gracilariopsis chorda TaxID=448386 RepID=A0A2V3ISK6_9FLOR|nr:hypothetical protein BWQ96_05147 [Gracilariopsis chorda]|eukprot:PXF45108.1 hypothetical protein BWQ96_05147 [Gracilariopsis chorda]